MYKLIIILTLCNQLYAYDWLVERLAPKRYIMKIKTVDNGYYINITDINNNMYVIPKNKIKKIEIYDNKIQIHLKTQPITQVITVHPKCYLSIFKSELLKEFSWQNNKNRL